MSNRKSYFVLAVLMAIVVLSVFAGPMPLQNILNQGDANWGGSSLTNAKNVSAQSFTLPGVAPTGGTITQWPQGGSNGTATNASLFNGYVGAVQLQTLNVTGPSNGVSQVISNGSGIYTIYVTNTGVQLYNSQLTLTEGIAPQYGVWANGIGSLNGNLAQWTTNLSVASLFSVGNITTHGDFVANAGFQFNSLNQPGIYLVGGALDIQTLGGNQQENLNVNGTVLGTFGLRDGAVVSAPFLYTDSGGLITGGTTLPAGVINAVSLPGFVIINQQPSNWTNLAGETIDGLLTLNGGVHIVAGFLSDKLWSINSPALTDGSGNMQTTDWPTFSGDILLPSVSGIALLGQIPKGSAGSVLTGNGLSTPPSYQTLPPSGGFTGTTNGTYNFFGNKFYWRTNAIISGGLPCYSTTNIFWATNTGAVAFEITVQQFDITNPNFYSYQKSFGTVFGVSGVAPTIEIFPVNELANGFGGPDFNALPGGGFYVTAPGIGTDTQSVTIEIVGFENGSNQVVTANYPQP